MTSIYNDEDDEDSGVGGVSMKEVADSSSVWIFASAGGLPSAIFTNITDISLGIVSGVLDMFIYAGAFPAGLSCPAGPRHPLPRGSGSVRL